MSGTPRLRVSASSRSATAAPTSAQCHSARQPTHPCPRMTRVVIRRPPLLAVVLIRPGRRPVPFAADCHSSLPTVANRFAYGGNYACAVARPTEVPATASNPRGILIPGRRRLRSAEVTIRCVGGCLRSFVGRCHTLPFGCGAAASWPQAAYGSSVGRSCRAVGRLITHPLPNSTISGSRRGSAGARPSAGGASRRRPVDPAEADFVRRVLLSPRVRAPQPSHVRKGHYG
jgi:hypothetical protein